MQKIDSEASLRAAILQMETEWIDEGKMLKEQMFLAFDRMKPINLLKSTFKEAIASRELKEDILNTAIGVAAGFLSKIIFQGVTKSPVKKLLGTALMFGVTDVVTKNPEAVKSLGRGLMRMIRGKKGSGIHRTDRQEPGIV